MKIKTIRQHDCTVGVLTFGGFRCFTLELPDINNNVNVSCIPAGLYECRKYNSPTHGLCIAIDGVVGRTDIRIHVANFTNQLLGCIAIGKSLIDLDNDGVIDVSSSRETLTALLAVLPDKFQLEITRL